MRSINSGNSYQIFDNSVTLYNNLPAQVYQIEFDPRQGFSLSAKDPIEVKEKVYGKHLEKANKVIQTFHQFERSLGVILSGDKGIGKSLFSKLLCELAVSNNIPVIICNGFIPGLAQFIDSMDQEVMVLFDEFDKTFNEASDENAQSSMLSVFDGISVHKKLFCITCNELRSLNAFLVNRPGRFHYHFRFEYPNSNEIQEYMKDHLPEDKWTEIIKIINFSQKTRLNYDCLRAIAFELHSATSFEEAISDLNITKFGESGCLFYVYVCFDDGTRFYEKLNLDLFDPEQQIIEIGAGSVVGDDYMEITLVPTDAIFSPENDALYIPMDKVKILDLKCCNKEDSWIMENHGEYIKSHRAANVNAVILRKANTNKSFRYFN